MCPPVVEEAAVGAFDVVEIDRFFGRGGVGGCCAAALALAAAGRRAAFSEAALGVCLEERCLCVASAGLLAAVTLLFLGLLLHFAGFVVLLVRVSVSLVVLLVVVGADFGNVRRGQDGEGIDGIHECLAKNPLAHEAGAGFDPLWFERVCLQVEEKGTLGRSGGRGVVFSVPLFGVEKLFAFVLVVALALALVVAVLGGHGVVLRRIYKLCLFCLGELLPRELQFKAQFVLVVGRLDAELCELRVLQREQ